MSAVALVTGASTGIGRATVQALVAAGYTAIATARRLDRLNALAGSLGARCHAVALGQPPEVTIAEIVVLPSGDRI